jgi:hypothetical protein
MALVLGRDLLKPLEGTQLKAAVDGAGEGHQRAATLRARLRAPDGRVFLGRPRSAQGLRPPS